MRTARILAAVAAGIVAGSVASAVLSRAGLLAYQDLLDYRAALAGNLDNLEQTNTLLNNYQLALASSEELLRLHARQLNYYRPEERVIRIQDGPRPTTFYEVGRVIAKHPVANGQRAGFIALGFATGTTVYVALMVARRRRRSARPGLHR